MLQAEERAIMFDAAGVALVGVVHLPETACTRGVLIVPGAPQYRVGPHRLFVDLARHLAGNGVAVLRMDRRGFGDNGAHTVEFEDAAAEIAAALAAFRQAAPELRSFAVLGLCDGASAALLHATSLPGVDGLILLNPWARSSAAEAQAVLNAYYLPRLLRWRRWMAVMTSFGRMRGALRGLAAAVLDGLKTRGDRQPAFVTAMLRNWINFPGRSLVVLSSRDLAAAEFDGLVRQTLTWPVLTRSANVTVTHMKDADHTFSARRHKAHLAEQILAWLES
jgi:exosortase A-associated hydrolase 1